jgi:tripartite-type tricarboxylate transporter receptor subunit TctC
MQLISVVGLVAAATAVAGCGSDNGDKTLSSEEYAAAVTRLCTTSAGELRRLVVASGGNFLVRKGDQFTELANKNVARLKDLRPPPELERKAQALVVAAEATRDRLVVVVRAAKKRPGSVNLGSSGLIDTRRRMIEAASALGATC